MKSKAEQCKEEGNKCMKEAKHTEAVIHYTQAIKLEPNSAVLHSNRSLAFLKIDQLYFALEDAEKAIKLEPSWPKGFFRKAEVELKAGNYTKALMSYRQAQLLDPSDDGIVAAISKAQKECAKERRDAARQPVLYSCMGLAIGVLIVIADQFVPSKPSIPHPVFQVILIGVSAGIGYLIAKAYRYLCESQRMSLLEEPMDLLKEMGHTSESKPFEGDQHEQVISNKKHGVAAGRQRMKKGKS